MQDSFPKLPSATGALQLLPSISLAVAALLRGSSISSAYPCRLTISNLTRSNLTNPIIPKETPLSLIFNSKTPPHLPLNHPLNLLNHNLHSKFFKSSSIPLHHIFKATRPREICKTANCFCCLQFVFQNLAVGGAIGSIKVVTENQNSKTVFGRRWMGLFD